LPVDPFDDENDDAEEAVPELYFSSLDLFMDWFVQIYRRATQGHNRVWCPEWWRHPEAIARLEALWRAFEHLRLDPALGMSVWWRDHVDPHLGVLTDPDGPLKGCSVEKGHAARPVEPMGHIAPPVGLFDRDDDGLTRPGPQGDSDDGPALAGRGSSAAGPAQSADRAQRSARLGM
jgi:hypothetical protein